MSYNILKLTLSTVIALCCIGALIIDVDGNAVWAVPVLTIVVGYVVGNAEFSSRTGPTSPIVSTVVKPTED